MLKELPDQTIILGVLDLSTPEIETPETVAARIRRALIYRKPEDIVVAPDCGLKYLPRDAAFGKMKAMVEGARIVRAELARDNRRAQVMPSRLALTLYEVSTWIIPLIIAITFHEAAHGFVAHLFGDNTAWRQGRVSFNPLKHIDPFGTILLPALLMITHSPFLFGYAKPVPVNFRALRRPKLDSVFVAAAGPGMNLALAILSAVLFHLVPLAPPTLRIGSAKISTTRSSSMCCSRCSISCPFRRSTADGFSSGFYRRGRRDLSPRSSPTACSFSSRRC